MNRKDFLVVISPDERIIKDISLYKKACAKHVGIFPGLYSKAHISLILCREEIKRPRQSTFIHEQYFKMISHTIAQIESVKLNIKGFNYFTHGKKTKTIYAELELSPEIIDWFNVLKKLLYIEGELTPHITIARTISFNDFDKLWPFFEKIEYHDSFTPDCITVLTREPDNGLKNYSLFTKLPFSNRLLNSVA